MPNLRNCGPKVAAAKNKAAETIPPEAFDWSEAETRKYKIDALLAEAGWTDLVEGRDTEYEVQGMPSASGVGYVDYVLRGADGRPLAVVEAKKALADPKTGQQQAEAICRLLGERDRAAAAHLLQQRLRALAMGRLPAPGPAGARVLLTR